MKIKFSVLVLASFLTLSSCKTTSISTETKKNNLKEIVNSPDVTLIDVRIPEQYNTATVKNAINIPLADLPEKADSLKDKKVVVFCNRGIQADQAVEILRKKGIEVYDGTSKYNVEGLLDKK